MDRSSTVRMNTKLSNDDAKEIKRILWLGTHTQEAIATAFGVSQTSVSRILRGRSFYDIPWPSGQVGPMPHERVRQVQMARSVGAHRHEGSTGVESSPPVRSDRLTHITRPDTRSMNDDDSSSSGAAAVAHPGDDDEELRDGSNTGSVVSSDDPPVNTDVTAGQNLNEPDDIVEVFRTNQEARAMALAELGDEADREMQDELAAIMSHAEGGARTSADQPADASPPTYDLMPWSDVAEIAPNNPVVIAAQTDEDLRYCVCAAFNMLPRSQWRSRQAMQLIKDIADSLGIDIAKEQDQ